jgi:hypothetical protein
MFLKDKLQTLKLKEGDNVMKHIMGPDLFLNNFPPWELVFKIMMKPFFL